MFPKITVSKVKFPVVVEMRESVIERSDEHLNFQMSLISLDPDVRYELHASGEEKEKEIAHFILNVKARSNYEAHYLIMEALEFKAVGE